MPTGSPKPNFIGVGHRGDNLFANCLIALDARTGRRLWHFQEIAHDIWDQDITAPPNLTTITREGKAVDVVAVTSKIGDTILLDRVTGKPIFPFRLRRAPTSELPGEVTAPYQPDPELPERFSKMEFTAADITDRTPEATEFVASRVPTARAGFFPPPGLGRPISDSLALSGHGQQRRGMVRRMRGPRDGAALRQRQSHSAWLISVFRDEDLAGRSVGAGDARRQRVYQATCAQCHGNNRMGIGVAQPPPLPGATFPAVGRGRSSPKSTSGKKRNAGQSGAGG